MHYGTECGVGADEHVIAYIHFGLVKDGKVEVSYKIIADMYIEAEITKERTVDYRMFSYIRKDLTYYILSLDSV